MSSPTYQRILRRGRLFLRSHIVDAGDHLLYVEGVFQERVRKFYYRDIQAIMWSKNTNAMIGRVLATIGCALPGLFLLLDTDPEWSLLFFLPALAGLIRLMWVQAQGGYCICCIVTAAQGQTILAAHHMRRARRLMAHIAEHPDVNFP